MSDDITVCDYKLDLARPDCWLVSTFAGTVAITTTLSATVIIGGRANQSKTLSEVYKFKPIIVCVCVCVCVHVYIDILVVCLSTNGERA